MAEVQRAVRVAVAESRASERLRVHRMLDVPLSQRNHGPLRQGPYLRVHGNPVDTNARTVTATPTNTVSNSITSIGEDEKDAQLQTVSGSVSNILVHCLELMFGKKSRGTGQTQEGSFAYPHFERFVDNPDT